MRLTLTDEEISEILTALYFSENDNTKLEAKIQEQWQRPIKPSKRNATIKATETRERAVKKKMENAINLMMLEGEKITAYSIAKKAEISYNSAKKYLYLFQND